MEPGSSPIVPLTFVGREAELAELLARLDEARAGRGSVLFIEAHPGLGKSQLVEAARARLKAQPGGDRAVVATGHCYPESSQQNAFQPFQEMLAGLAGPATRERKVGGALGAALKRTAPDWLGAIPVVGGLLSAGVKTAQATSEMLAADTGGGTRLDQVIRRQVDDLVKVAAGAPLLFLILEDAHWVDRASCLLMQHLAQHLSSSRIALVVTVRPDELARSEPLVALRADLSARGLMHTIRLRGLEDAAVTAYLQARFHGDLDPGLAQWLHQLCLGHPLYVTQYLSLLEQEGVIHRAGGRYHLDGEVVHRDGAWVATGRLGEIAVTGDLEALLDQRIHRLGAEEREMLQVAAVHGRTFGSLVLAEVFQQRELSVLSRLRQVAENHRLIAVFTGQDWMADKSEMYAFEHALLHQAFYRKLGPRERLLYHREVAAVLGKLLGGYPVPPRKLLLDLAHHSRLGGDLAAAAAHAWAAALSSHMDGASSETIQLCLHALESLGGLPPDQGARDRREVDVALLALSATLYGSVDRALNARLLGVAGAAETRAGQLGDLAALSRLMACRAQLLIRAGRTDAAIDLMHQAVATARASGHELSTFFALVQLGKQLTKQDLAAGMAVRYEAYERGTALAADGALEPDTRRELARQLSIFRVELGVGEFDQGDFARALEWLNRGLRELQAAQMVEEQLAAHNYLGQVYLALGRFADAEKTLRESFGLLAQGGPEANHPWLGYNLGQLGKVYLDWGRPESASEVLREARRISEAAGQADLLTLVRNFEAEWLMTAGHPESDTEAAAALLERNRAESSAAGLHRSAIQAMVLQSRLARGAGDAQAALAPAEAAAAELSVRGDMPALRSEEVLFELAQVFEAVGRAEEACALVTRARAILEEKAGRLADPADRDHFLTQVPLNRAIVRWPSPGAAR